MPYSLDAPISYDRHPKAPGVLGHLIHGSALRPTTGHHCGMGHRTEMSTATEGPRAGPFLLAPFFHGEEKGQGWMMFLRHKIGGSKKH